MEPALCPCCGGYIVDTDNEYLSILQCSNCGVSVIEGLFHPWKSMEIVYPGYNTFWPDGLKEVRP